jgi:hypothetical protein
MFRHRENKSREHERELARIRSQRYYQRHKQELKESKKYGSLWAYRRAQREQLEKLSREAQKLKKQEFVPQSFL